MSSLHRALRCVKIQYSQITRHTIISHQIRCRASIHPHRNTHRPSHLQRVSLSIPSVHSFSFPSAPRKHSRSIPQSRLPRNMSQIPIATTSASNYQSIFDNAIEAYKKKTKKDLRSHPLLDKLQNCHSPHDVLSILYDQIPGFDQSRDTDAKLTKWLNPTVSVLCTFSGVIGGGIGPVSPKALRTQVVPYLMIDGHTGIPASCGDLCWNRCPSLSEF